MLQFLKVQVLVFDTDKLPDPENKLGITTDNTEFNDSGIIKNAYLGYDDLASIIRIMPVYPVEIDKITYNEVCTLYVEKIIQGSIIKEKIHNVLGNVEELVTKFNKFIENYEEIEYKLNKVQDLDGSSELPKTKYIMLHVKENPT